MDPSEVSDIVMTKAESLTAEWHRVVAFYTLRLSLAPLVETAILLDRMLFLYEHGQCLSWTLWVLSVLDCEHSDYLSRILWAWWISVLDSVSMVNICSRLCEHGESLSWTLWAWWICPELCDHGESVLNSVIMVNLCPGLGEHGESLSWTQRASTFGFKSGNNYLHSSLVLLSCSFDLILVYLSCQYLHRCLYISQV